MIRQAGEPLYDFPCSYTFRAYEALMDEGIELPSIDPPTKEPEPPSPTEGKQWHTIQQLKGQVVWQGDKINEQARKLKEHMDKKEEEYTFEDC